MKSLSFYQIQYFSITVVKGVTIIGKEKIVLKCNSLLNPLGYILLERI